MQNMHIEISVWTLYGLPRCGQSSIRGKQSLVARMSFRITSLIAFIFYIFRKKLNLYRMVLRISKKILTARVLVPNAKRRISAPLVWAYSRVT